MSHRSLVISTILRMTVILIVCIILGNLFIWRDGGLEDKVILTAIISLCMVVAGVIRIILDWRK